MRKLWPILLLVARSAPAQGTDPFAEDWDDEGDTRTLNGFVEVGYGNKLDSDPLFRNRQSLGDVRLRLETEWSSDAVHLTVKAEALYDDYESSTIGRFRDLSIGLSPAKSLDLKIGRQVLTWGTGDLLFLNDLFPKSWVSFFAGRDDEYLKVPSSAVRLTWYTDRINVDAAWLPKFEPDDYLTGQRFSFFSPAAGAVVAPRPPLSAEEPRGGIDNGELALRLFGTKGQTEYAAYFYHGFFKRPLGLDAAMRPIFPRLAVYGASLRRPLSAGILNTEFAYHDSRMDPSGTDPLIPNSQLRLLLGYEFEAATRFTVGLQYYLEWTQDHGELLANSPAPAFEPDERRHVLTNRLTYRTGQDRLTLSLFTFYSPSDNDYYFRPGMSIRYSDQWTFVFGANLFHGEQPHTFFGQLENDSNAYFRVRHSF